MPALRINVRKIKNVLRFKFEGIQHMPPVSQVGIHTS
jgi:hypothetical protein